MSQIYKEEGQENMERNLQLASSSLQWGVCSFFTLRKGQEFAVTGSSAALLPHQTPIPRYLCGSCIMMLMDGDRTVGVSGSSTKCAGRSDRGTTCAPVCHLSC